VAAGCGGVSSAGDAQVDAPSAPDAGPSACNTPVSGTPPLGREVVASGLDRPVLVTAPPGDPRLFIVEQVGTIRIVEEGTLLQTPFLDVSGDVSGGNEQGLLGLAFAPDYATSGKFFINYTDNAGDTNVEQVLVSSDPNVADGQSRSQVLFVSQPYSNHNGGNLVFGPKDGLLYIGLGDGGSGGDPEGNGQNLGALLGKMLRIDVSSLPYTIPPDNPFVGMGGVEAEIWAWGLRNPWRYSFDRETGDLYIGDVGQNTWEEVDIEPASSPGGVNYGWNTVEGNGHCYGGGGCDQTGMTNPLYEYDHGDGCSITGGYVYRGCRMPDYHGTYFVADYCDGWVRSFTWDSSTNTISAVTDQPGLSGGNPSSFGEDADGELYISDLNGTVYRVVPQ
jgi:glucose/arabinose dehydrogenase